MADCSTIQEQQDSTDDKIVSDEEAKEQSIFCQVLPGQNAPDLGFFISKVNAERAGFRPGKRWIEHVFRMQNGNSESGYLCSAPKISIVHFTPLMMFFRDSGYFAQLFNTDVYRAPENAGKFFLRTRFLLYFLDEDNTLLSEEPIAYSATKSFGSVFGQKLSQYRKEVKAFMQKEENDPKLNPNRFVHALWTWQLVLTGTLKGNENKAWACDIERYTQISQENYDFLFLGNNEKLASVVKKIKSAYDDNLDFPEQYKTYQKDSGQSYSPDQQVQGQPQPQPQGQEPSYTPNNQFGDLPPVAVQPAFAASANPSPPAQKEADFDDIPF